MPEGASDPFRAGAVEECCLNRFDTSNKGVLRKAAPNAANFPEFPRNSALKAGTAFDLP